jgi:hypothetical protein
MELMENEMKQTAVEWLAETLRFANKELYAEMYEDIEQAKEMERQQMDKVAGDWWNEGASYMHNGGRKYESFEQYYNKTFNTKEK